MVRKVLLSAGAIAMLALSATAARASSIEVTVAATAGPWNWVAGGLNSGYAYGLTQPDFTPPTTVSLASLGLNPGDSIYILYKSGLTNASGSTPDQGPAGHVGSVFKD